MKEKIKKVLFYVFLPISLVLLGIKFFLDLNKEKADKSLDKTNDTDHKLELQQVDLENKSNAHLEKANELEKQIKDEKNEDLDWHKKV